MEHALGADGTYTMAQAQQAVLILIVMEHALGTS